MLKQIAIMNRARLQKGRDREKSVKEAALEVFEKHRNDALFLSGAALYWGEGERFNNNGRKFQLAFTNSDPSLLKFYCKFLHACFRDIFTINDWRVGLFLYPDIDAKKTISYWSSVLSVPQAQFIKSQVLNGNHIQKKRLKFGTCCVYVNSKDACLTMNSWTGSICDLMRR
jgi:hypothetical protein